MKHVSEIRSAIFFVFIFAIAVFIGFEIESSRQKNLIATYEFDADINVLEEKYTAINLDKDAMHFGAGPIGTKMSRSFNITNTYSHPVFVKILTDDSEFGSWIYAESSVIGPNSNRPVPLTLKIPINASVGNHKGKITVMIYSQNS